MPVKPTLIEHIALSCNVAPSPVLDYVGALGLQAVLMAERLGVFEALQDQPKSESELAADLQANERGVRALLVALRALGYIRVRDNRYSLTAMARRWTPRFREGIGFYQWMAFDGWSDLQTQLKTDMSNGVGHCSNETVRKNPVDTFGGMLSTSRLAANEIPKRIPLKSSARRLLDIGCGHGVYSAQFCQRSPKLSATLVDHEPVLEKAREILTGEGLSDRVDFRAGDFWIDDLGSGYDITLLFNVLNAYDVISKVALLRRAADTISPSGIVVILDQMQRPTLHGVARAVVELTNLRLFDSYKQDTYRYSDLLVWLARAGLKSCSAGSLRTVPWMSFVVAQKQTNGNQE